MIDLLVADDRRGFGIATALAIEGIPARRIARAAEFDGRVLVVSADRLDDAAAALGGQVPTVVIGDGEGRGTVTDEPLALALDGAIWPPSVRKLARAYGNGALVVPCATRYGASSDLDGSVLATLQDARGRRTPAVVQRLTLRELDRGLPGAELRVQVAS